MKYKEVQEHTQDGSEKLPKRKGGGGVQDKVEKGRDKRNKRKTEKGKGKKKKKYGDKESGEEKDRKVKGKHSNNDSHINNTNNNPPGDCMYTHALAHTEYPTSYKTSQMQYWK